MYDIDKLHCVPIKVVLILTLHCSHKRIVAQHIHLRKQHSGIQKRGICEPAIYGFERHKTNIFYECAQNLD